MTELRRVLSEVYGVPSFGTRMLCRGIPDVKSFDSYDMDLDLLINEWLLKNCMFLIIREPDGNTSLLGVNFKPPTLT